MDWLRWCSFNSGEVNQVMRVILHWGEWKPQEKRWRSGDGDEEVKLKWQIIFRLTRSNELRPLLLIYPLGGGALQRTSDDSGDLWFRDSSSVVYWRGMGLTNKRGDKSLIRTTRWFIILNYLLMMKWKDKRITFEEDGEEEEEKGWAEEEASEMRFSIVASLI